MMKINKEKKNIKESVVVSKDAKRERLLAKMLRKKKQMLTEKVLTFSWNAISVNYRKKALLKPIFRYMDFVIYHYSHALVFENISRWLYDAIRNSYLFFTLCNDQLKQIFVERSKKALLFCCTWVLALNIRKSENYLESIWIKKVIKGLKQYNKIIFLINMALAVAGPLKKFFNFSNPFGLIRWKAALKYNCNRIRQGYHYYCLYFDYFLLSSDLWHNKNRLTGKSDSFFDLRFNPAIFLKPYSLNLSKHEGEDADEQPDENLTSLRHVTHKSFLVLHTSIETQWNYDYTQQYK